MIILPAIDILDGKCVQLVRGEYDTAAKVAENPVETAKHFCECGAEYIHMVDLNGAKSGVPVNAEIFVDVAKNIDIPVELGGGIRDMQTVDYYLNNGINRVILGSVVLIDKNFAEKAVLKYGDRIAVGIDAKNRKVKTSGWLVESDVDFIELALEMTKIGVKNIIYTDISKDGTLTGINFEHYKELKKAVPSDVNITASGGVRSISDIVQLCSLDIYGAICGTSIYSGTLDLKEAVEFTKNYNSIEDTTVLKLDFMKLKKFFENQENQNVIPVAVQNAVTQEVILIAYTNEIAFKESIKQKKAIFWSTSRNELWYKGKDSGNTFTIQSIYVNCEQNSLVYKVIPDKGNICHTTKNNIANNCFYRELDLNTLELVFI